MAKRVALFVSLSILVFLVIVIFLFYALFKPGNEERYKDRIESGELINPVSDLSLEEAKVKFNEEYIYYLVYSIGAYNLHNPPLSSDKPVINIKVEELKYYAIINEGEIEIYEGELDNSDVVIDTSKEEIVRILQKSQDVKDSFNQGKSSLALVADKSTLFSKGYLNLYGELTGKSITGGVIGVLSG